jgi:pyrroloquinoline quinone biosynthesis protein D
LAIRLSPGVRLDGAKEKDAVLVLMSPEGKVRLNRSAAAILRLCDGSRNREDVIAEVVRDSHGQIRTVEITEFLDAAQSRGWIRE